MPEKSDPPRPSIETKAMMKARHAAELQMGGFDTKVRKYGAWAGAITAIIGLFILIGTQVWPWMVQFGVKAQLDALRKNTEAVEALTTAQTETHNLLIAAIRASDEQAAEDDLRAQGLHDALQALKMEVRLRHGVLDINELGSLTLSTGSSGAGGGVSRTPASRPRRLSASQRLRAVTQQADTKIAKAKADPTADFGEDVKAKLKTIPKDRKKKDSSKAMAF